MHDVLAGNSSCNISNPYTKQASHSPLESSPPVPLINMIFKGFAIIVLSTLFAFVSFSIVMFLDSAIMTGSFSYYPGTPSQLAFTFSPEIERFLGLLPDLQRGVLSSDLEDREEVAVNLLTLGLLTEKSGEALTDYVTRTTSQIDHVLFFLRHALPLSSRPSTDLDHFRQGPFGWGQYLAARFNHILYGQFSSELASQEVVQALEAYTTLVLEMRPHEDIVYYIMIMLEVHIESLLDTLSPKHGNPGHPEDDTIKADIIEALQPLQKPTRTLLNMLNALQATTHFLKSFGNLLRIIDGVSVSTQEYAAAIACGCALARGQLLLLLQVNLLEN